MNNFGQRKRYYGGILALAAVVFIWVSSSFAMNSIFGDMQYSKPFLITYLNTATFSFYLLPTLFKKLRQEKSNESTKLLSNEVLSKATSYTSIPTAKTLESDKISTYETIKFSLEFCILWFFANYTTNSSLAYTSVGSSTILSSMSGLFTLGIGAIFKVEKMNLLKLSAVVISLIGVSFVSYSDHLSSGDDEGGLTDKGHYAVPAPIIGDTLALLGAVFYGIYTNLLKVRIGNEDRINMPLFFGFVGAFNILLLWPMMPILHYTGIEPFEIPTNATLWTVILLNAFIGTFLSDYLWLLSMLMTSPLVVTLGISLTIPLALVGDIVFKGFIPSGRYILGALLVIVGFLAVNTEAYHESQEKKEDSLLAIGSESVGVEPV